MSGELALLGALISILLSVIAYFVRQLHGNFRQVEQDMAEVKTAVEVIKTELKANYELLKLRMAFLEHRRKTKRKHKPPLRTEA